MVAAAAEKHRSDSTCALFNVSCRIKHSSGTHIGSRFRKKPDREGRMNQSRLHTVDREDFAAGSGAERAEGKVG